MRLDVTSTEAGRIIGDIHYFPLVASALRTILRFSFINRISLRMVPTPYAAANTASKCFTASLRREMGAHPGVRNCAVFPSIIDTPGFAHGANVSGGILDLGPFLYRAKTLRER
jgi:NAD(P)-dependent dehydrogenase (short-subunit alcohol dehydrogenase family)